MVLLHRAEAIQVGKQGKKAVPRAVGIEQHRGFAGEIHIQRLIADEDGNGLEQILQRRTGSENKGVGLDDLALDVRQGNPLVAVRIVDVPALAKEAVEKAGTDFTVGVSFTANGSSKANFGHDL